MGVFKSILVGYDGSDNSARALDRAIELAKQSDAKLRVAVVLDNLRYSSYPRPGLYRAFNEEATLNAKKLAGSARDRARAAGLEEAVSVDEQGQPADRLLSLAMEYESDLIVVGRRGITCLKRFFMGSVSRAVVNYATCDVLVVR
jgi:nucleotide-binding universal stress UspA family protein